MFIVVYTILYALFIHCDALLICIYTCKFIYSSLIIFACDIFIYVLYIYTYINDTNISLRTYYHLTHYPLALFPPLGVASDNYPEMMHKCHMVNAPWLFNTVWWVIKGWLSPRYCMYLYVPPHCYDHLHESDSSLTR